jgi:RNA polymerase sigma-70 factor (ECF subfamily)
MPSAQPPPQTTDDRPRRGDAPRPAPDPAEARDEALLAAHRAGDPGALDELLTAFQDRLFAVCLRMAGDRETARDLTQDAMVKIIQGLDRFDGRSRLSTWMIRVTINTCLSHRRRQRLRDHAPLDAIADPDAHAPHGAHLADHREPTPDDRVEHQRQTRVLYAGLQRIDPAQRAIIVLRDAHGLDYARIAEILDVPRGTVKSRLFRARSALRDAMALAEQEPETTRD